MDVERVERLGDRLALRAVPLHQQHGTVGAFDIRRAAADRQDRRTVDHHQVEMFGAIAQDRCQTGGVDILRVVIGNRRIARAEHVQPAARVLGDGAPERRLALQDLGQPRLLQSESAGRGRGIDVAVDQQGAHARTLGGEREIAGEGGFSLAGQRRQDGQNFAPRLSARAQQARADGAQAAGIRRIGMIERKARGHGALRRRRCLHRQQPDARHRQRLRDLPPAAEALSQLLQDQHQPDAADDPDAGRQRHQQQRAGAVGPQRRQGGRHDSRVGNLQALLLGGFLGAIEELLEQRAIGLRLALELAQLDVGLAQRRRLILQLGQLGLERRLTALRGLVVVAHAGENARHLVVDLPP